MIYYNISTANQQRIVTIKPPGFQKHDHELCVSSALDIAERVCRERKVQLTPIRRRVLEILLKQHKALGAYDILDVLKVEGHAAQPPVAYRALDFLVKNGLVHKVERLNAFVACAIPGEEHSAAFLICRSCDVVTETESASQALDAAAADAGFELEATVVEAEGICPNCRPAP